MEAVRIDTLPSTESNKLCSLLSTDARDSNDISKEKEEELLYGAGEDVDEDEALSDDSLRLKFSDDEEADQDLDADSSSEHCYKPVKEEDTSEGKMNMFHDFRCSVGSTHTVMFSKLGLLFISFAK